MFEMIACPNCKSQLNTDFLVEKYGNDAICCPVCDEPLEESDNVGWTLECDPKSVKSTKKLRIICDRCNSINYIDRDKFAKYDKISCRLKPTETHTCINKSCGQVMTSNDYITRAVSKTFDDGTHPIHCPSCGSGEVKKIGIGNKAFALAALDYGAAGYISKTFKCRHCGYTW